jgi:hypothetical protein
MHAAATSGQSMADYYPPIAQAVNSLQQSTAETRRAIYDRARAAMVAQLRSLTPPFSESAIHREQLALEEAIRKTETESLRRLRPSPHRSSRQPDPPPRPLREAGDEQAEMSVADGLPRLAKQPRSSSVLLQHIRLRPKSVPRSSMEEKISAATWSRRRRQTLVILSVMGLLGLVAAASGILRWPGNMASFRGTSITETTAPERRGVRPKIADRFGSAPIASSSPSPELNLLAAQKVMLHEEDQFDAAGERFGGTAAWRAESLLPDAGQSPTISLPASGVLADPSIDAFKFEGSLRSR